jgi:hypothetical protein
MHLFIDRPLITGRAARSHVHARYMRLNTLPGALTLLLRALCAKHTKTEVASPVCETHTHKKTPSSITPLVCASPQASMKLVVLTLIITCFVAFDAACEASRVNRDIAEQPECTRVKLLPVDAWTAKAGCNSA